MLGPRNESESELASEKRGEPERARFCPGTSEKNREQVVASGSKRNFEQPMFDAF